MKTRYQDKLSHMNKLRLFFFLFLFACTALIIQSCNKDAVTSTAFTTAAFQANINGSTWAPDSVTTVVNYNSDAKTKTLYCIGTKQAKQVIFSVTLPNAGDTPGFTLGQYNIDAVTVTAQYNTQQKNSSGVYVFMSHGTVEAGAGVINVTAVDSVKKTDNRYFCFLFQVHYLR